MKLTSLFFLLAIFHVSAADTEAQRVSFRKNGASVLEILQTIRQQTGYLYICDLDMVQKVPKVDVNIKSGSIHDVLETAFKDLPLTYVIHQKTIIVRNKPVSGKQETGEMILREPHEPVLPAAERLNPARVIERLALSHPADRTVRGNVSDESGERLPGVNVLVKGTQSGTTTGAEGDFTLVIPDNNAVLVFSYVGYVTKEITAGNQTRFEVTLQVDEKALDEVVVVGYGTQKKSDVTGALSRISADDIRERPAQNMLQAVQGKAAGVHVSSNMRPGELPVVRVRGTRSIGASNDPLYVVDGIPIVSILGVSSFTVNDINPNDIASIEILKDASATAIYGSRGANGVVLITTNKGKKGRISLQYNGTLSLDSFKELTDWMSGGEYVDRWRLATMNGRLYQNTANTNLNEPTSIWYPDPFLDRDRIVPLSSDPEAINAVWQGYEWEEYGVTPRMRSTTPDEQALGWPNQVPIYNSRNVANHNWRKQAIRQGITQNHQVSVNAGSDISRLSVSLGFFDQLGVQRDQDFRRYTANLSGDITATKWLTLGTSILASYSEQEFGILGPNTSNTGSKDLYSRSTDQFPFLSPTNADGSYRRFSQLNVNLFNPLIDVDQVRNNRRTTAIMANAFADVKFTPWLRYRLNFGAQNRQFRSGSWTGPNATSHLTNRPNTAGYATDQNFSWVLENLLYFDKTFADNHTIGITLLQSAQKSTRENTSTSVTGLINPLSLWYDLASNTVGNPGIGTGFTENTLASFMGRLNYTFKNKYLVTVSGRTDGSSVLAPGYQWDFFPSLALAWKMQEEQFLSGLNWITELKPRFGFGVTGNSSVNPYTTSGPLSRNPYVFGSAAAIGYLPQLAQNPELRWEQTRQINLGLDFAVLDSRISGSIEYYKQNTSDLIFPKTLPAVSGYVTKFENVGKTMNRGVELTLSATPISKRDLNWTVDLNWAANREEIVELVNGKEDMIANGLFIGQPTQVFRQYDNQGVWGATPTELEEMAKFNANGTNFVPGTVRVVDQNGDYRIDGADLVIRGTARPRWTGGITNTLTYKNWSLNSFVYFRWGQTYFGGYPNSYGGVNPNGRVENDVWSFSNPGGRWPMPNAANGLTNHTGAMQYINGSFGAVRNISLSYDFPKNLLGKIAAKNLSVNVQVLNPFIFGSGVVKLGLNPDDDTNWSLASGNTNPLGGTNNNTILPQSYVLGLRVGF